MSYFQSIDADGEREDEDVPSGAKSGDGKSDKEQDQKPVGQTVENSFLRHSEYTS